MTIKDLFEQKIFQFYSDYDETFCFYEIVLDEDIVYFIFEKDYSEFLFYQAGDLQDDLITLEDLDYFICDSLNGKIYKTKEDYKKDNFIKIERLWNNYAETK